MAYRILCDGNVLFDLRDPSFVVSQPQLDIEINKVGTLKFNIAPTHPNYDAIKKLVSEVIVYQGDAELFRGRPIIVNDNFFKLRHVECEGELGLLNDSVQRPQEFHDMTIRGYLEHLISEHNLQVEPNKQFKVGAVTVTNTTDSLYRYTNYNSTMQEIKEDLVDDLGGYLFIRHVDGVRYLDYLASFPETSNQVITFGVNLLDLTKNFDLTDLATSVIPLGAAQEERSIAALDERVTIKDVNNGSDFISSQEAVNTYGWITKTVTFDNVNTPYMLKKRGESYLADSQFEDMVIEAKAVDMGFINGSIPINIGQIVRVLSPPHGLDRYFPVSKLSLKLDDIQNNSISLGRTEKLGLTARTSSTNSGLIKKIERLPSKSDVLKEAQDNATELINSRTTGYVVTTGNEQLIMDTEDIETATKVWRWNLNGLGYSPNGYKGPFNTAITMDGGIMGEFLVAGSVSTEQISVVYTKEIEDKYESYVEDELTNYWTAATTESKIQNTADSVLISASLNAMNYTNNKLNNYYSKAEINVKTDSITTEVNKKVNDVELGTKITQNAYYVRVAWNNNSNYLQFDPGRLSIYNGVKNDTQLRSYFDENGIHFFRNNAYVGKIGTNTLTDDSNKKGLEFDLQYAGGHYMAWASQLVPGGTYYTKLLYLRDSVGSKTGNRLYAGCDLDMQNFTLRNFTLDTGGISGSLNFVQVISMSSSGTANSWASANLRFSKGILVSGSWN